jgi:2-polyprenyl-3-methyl-5-hydroxy-6-metoxy-1,4-benzoquinol methylase
MNNNDKVVSNYGWRDSEAKPSQAYLGEPIRDILASLKAKRVLDLGCGNGVMAHWMQSRGFDVVGCDVDVGGVEIAVSGKSGAVFKQVGVYDPPERLGECSFDAVYSTEVIEHLFLVRRRFLGLL